MPVVIACPICQQKVRVNENLLGKSVKCPQCKNPFTAVDPNAAVAPTWEAVTQKPELDFTSPPPPQEPPEEEFDDEDVPAHPATRKSGGSGIVDYLLFRRMVTPWVILVLFYVGVVVLIGLGLFQAVSGVIALASGHTLGLALIFGALFGTLFGILLLRVYCEVVAVFFRILDNVRQINERLEQGVKTQENKSDESV
jgi:hypothetical protein